MKVLFVAGFGPIVRDLEASARFYRDLGLPLPDGDYVATDDLPGVKHFGLWTLADAAESCFGTKEWPKDVPVPAPRRPPSRAVGPDRRAASQPGGSARRPHHHPLDAGGRRTLEA